ncbi:Glycyl-tRNA synthetase beta chain [hydrothermal vent metagenome]|uniref:glycine--tRNA ligase n=1 Tax=hydrothermal vent metagenome TaxID=652676 RepID=A0A3B0S069_9ZZZZ
MAELLLEIFSEEIPARMQNKAAADLQRLLGKALTEAGFAFTDVQSFAGPRRLTLVIADLPAKSPDITEQRKGPRVGAPEQAVAGFLRGAGVASLDECEQCEDKKGKYWVANLHKPGQSAADILAQNIPKIMASFPWPKSMKWGSGSFRWVRPLHGIVCLLDGKIVSFEVAGIKSGNQIFGHRIMGPGPFSVSSFADYRQQLEGAGHVMLDAAQRKTRITEQIEQLCKTNKLTLVEDAALLDEVAGLAEWPVVLLGEMDETFLDLPPEVITLSMAKHQKYFSVNNAKTNKLAPNFLVVANLDAPDGGTAITAGNARVLSARLADARHFWDMDRAQTLESRVDALRDVVFHQKLGSVYDKAERVAKLARELAAKVGADPDLAERAAWLAKADLTTQMVVEFTSLQGVMGRYYALADGSPPPSLRPTSPTKGGGKEGKDSIYGSSSTLVGEVAAQPTEGGLSSLPTESVTQIANAIRDHYKPQGPTDITPTEPVSIAVALADKLDTLVGFWAIDEKPTGSKDPYALRRAALGVIRILLENGVRMPIPAQLSEFVFDRLKVHLREQGIRHDLIDAVLTPGADDLMAIVARVEALSAFLATPDGEQLLAGTKRAANIVKAEEKKQKQKIEGEVNPDLFTATEEKALYKALQTAAAKAAKAIDAENYTAAMAALAPLRGPIDAFFEAVMVNDNDPKVRQNRLALLSGIRAALTPVADFDKIAG